MTCIWWLSFVTVGVTRTPCCHEFITYTWWMSNSMPFTNCIVVQWVTAELQIRMLKRKTFRRYHGDNRWQSYCCGFHTYRQNSSENWTISLSWFDQIITLCMIVITTKFHVCTTLENLWEWASEKKVKNNLYIGAVVRIRDSSLFDMMVIILLL